MGVVVAEIANPSGIRRNRHRKAVAIKTRASSANSWGHLGALIHGAGSKQQQAGVWERPHHTLLD
jgi:hypothetical protein